MELHLTVSKITCKSRKDFISELDRTKHLFLLLLLVTRPKIPKIKEISMLEISFIEENYSR